jgi:glycosyltransferase 2 family protein
VQRILDAAEAFFDTLSSVDLGLVALAICCHLVKLACVARAWRNVLRAAYPRQRVPYRSILAAYVAGVGTNAVIPARAGDVLRVYLTHRAIPGATYTTLVSSTAVMAIVDLTLATLLFLWALTQGLLPSADSLPDLPGFDFAWLFDNPVAAQLLVLAGVLALIVVVVWGRYRIDDFGQRIGQAFAVMRPPRRWLQTVVPWQLADWSLRIATIWFFLGAFGIDQSLRNALLVQVTLSLATLVPATPGGIGTEQAFLTVVLRGSAPASVLLAFSVGMRITLTVVNVIAGIVAIGATLGTMNLRSAVRSARAAQPEQGDGPQDPRPEP